MLVESIFANQFDQRLRLAFFLQETLLCSSNPFQRVTRRAWGGPGLNTRAKSTAVMRPRVCTS